MGAKQGEQMNPILENRLERLEQLMRENDQEHAELTASAESIEKQLRQNEYNKIRLAKQYGEVTVQLSIPMLNPIGAY